MNNEAEFLEAVKGGDRSTVEQMLAANRDRATARDANGVSALLLAIYYGQGEIADLLRASGIELTIFEAAATGDARRVAELLDADASLANAQSPDGFHPLGLASFFGHPDVARLLIESGADVEAPATNGMQVRPIHSASANRDASLALTLARILLEHGADANVPQQAGWRPLHQAAAHGNRALMALLLEHGADPDATNDDGLTPRDMAVKNGHDDVVDLFV